MTSAKPDLGAKPYSEEELAFARRWADSYSGDGGNSAPRWLATIDSLTAEHAATVARLTIERDNALAFCAEMRQQRNVVIQEHAATVDRLEAEEREATEDATQLHAKLLEREAECARLRQAIADVHNDASHDAIYAALDEYVAARKQRARTALKPLSPPASPPQAEAPVFPNRVTLVWDGASYGPQADEGLSWLTSRVRAIEQSDARVDYIRADLADEAVRLLRDLIASLPKCGNGAHESRPATRAWGRGGERYCDECGAPNAVRAGEVPEYPRANPLRAAIAFLARLDAGSKAK